MGREIRMIPPGWQHPKDDKGRYIPLHKGSFAQADADWNEGYAAWQRGEVENYAADEGEPKWKAKEGSALECASYTEWSGSRPSPDDYMPAFPEGTATHLCMYEDTSEGTPISPGFATPEELARWLADTGASAFGGKTATYEQWLGTCKSGWAVSAVMEVSPTGNRMMSGVEAQAS